MSGFAAWVASPAGWAFAGICMLGLGLVLGELDGQPRGRRRALAAVRADRAGRRAARQFRAMRQPELRHERARPGAGRLVGKQLPARSRTAAFLDPTPYGTVMFAAAAPELAHEWEPKRSPSTEEWEPAHVASALAVALGQADPTVTGWTQAAATWLDQRIEEQHADTDRWLAGLLAEHPVPYPDADQGQLCLASRIGTGQTLRIDGSYECGP